MVNTPPTTTTTLWLDIFGSSCRTMSLSLSFMDESPDRLNGPRFEGQLIKETQIMTQMLKIDPPQQIMVAPKSKSFR